MLTLSIWIAIRGLQAYIATVKRKDASFVRSAGLISLLTLVSRLLGLAREAVCAYYFGAGEIWGDFSIAFRIPNLSRRLFGEGALSAAFIPVLTERLHQDDRRSATRLAGGVVLLLSVVLLGLVILGEAAIWVARRYSSDLSLSLTAVMLPYMFFICLVALLAGAQNVMGRFGLPAMMPILFNVIVISGAVVGGLWAGGHQMKHIYILSGAVLLAGVVQLILQWRALLGARFRPALEWNPSHPDIKRIIATMAPMVIGLAAVQLNSLADLLVAKVFVEQGGGAAVLSYGERLYQLPIGLFGAAIATAIYPQLARLATSSDKPSFGETLQRGIRLALFVGLPASLGLFAIRTPAVRVLYEHGEFGPADTIRVAKVVGCYGLGVWAYVSQQVLVRGYYSLRNTKTPMRVAAGVVLLNLGLNLLLVQWYEESGIAIATAASAAVQVFLLGILSSRTGLPVVWKPIVEGAAKALLASIIMFLAIWSLDRAVGDWGEDLPSGVLHLVLLVATGLIAFAVAARALRCEELGYLRHVEGRSDGSA